MRKEFAKVHDRYTELLKVHMDHVERTRGLLGADRLAEGVGPKTMSSSMNSWNLNINLTPPTVRSTGPLSFGFTSLENASVVNSSHHQTGSMAIHAAQSPPQAIQDELDMSVDSARDVTGPSDVWSSPSRSASIVKKFDVAVTSPVHEGKSLKRKYDVTMLPFYIPN